MVVFSLFNFVFIYTEYVLCDELILCLARSNHRIFGSFNETYKQTRIHIFCPFEAER